MYKVGAENILTLQLHQAKTMGESEWAIDPPSLSPTRKTPWGKRPETHGDLFNESDDNDFMGLNNVSSNLPKQNLEEPMDLPKESRSVTSTFNTPATSSLPGSSPGAAGSFSPKARSQMPKSLGESPPSSPKAQREVDLASPEPPESFSSPVRVPGSASPTKPTGRVVLKSLSPSESVARSSLMEDAQGSPDPEVYDDVRKAFIENALWDDFSDRERHTRGLPLFKEWVACFTNVLMLFVTIRQVLLTSQREYCLCQGFSGWIPHWNKLGASRSHLSS